MTLIPVGWTRARDWSKPYLKLVLICLFGTQVAPVWAHSETGTTASVISDTVGVALPEPPCGGAVHFSASWIPARQADAETGSDFVKRTTGWDGRRRQAAALEELRLGNMPDFLRQLKPVSVPATLSDGRTVDIVLWVTPDYVSVGSDSDFVRMPLSLPVAVTLANELGFVLPTRKIVDIVYEQAEFRLPPKPLPFGTMMRSSQYYEKHNAAIEAERQGRPLGELLAGHKKDIVMTNRVFGTEKIAIYGWHKKDGKPIQGLSLVHAARYADYSHGVRLVYSIVCVDGIHMPILRMFQDRELASALTFEGILQQAQRFMDRRTWQ